MKRFVAAASLSVIGVLVAMLAGCAALPSRESGERLSGSPARARFGSVQAFEAWRRAWAEHQPAPRVIAEVPPPPAPPSPTDMANASGNQTLDRIDVTGSRVDGGDSVTNTQEAGVDEGGLVKRVGDFLLVLRDGVLYSVRIVRDGREVLELAHALAVDMEDDGEEVWYDEILSYQSTVLLLGFNYGSDPAVAEMVVFDVSPDGRLQRQSRLWLGTEDYFSSQNYGARLIGDRLLLRLRQELVMDDEPEAVMRWQRRDAARPRWRPLLDLGELHLPVFDLEWPIIHALLSCSVEGLRHGDLACDRFGVVGNDFATVYASPQAAYLALGHSWRDKARKTTVFRLPIDDWQAATHVAVEGVVDSPLQFADRDNGLYVAAAAGPSSVSAGSRHPISHLPVHRFAFGSESNPVAPAWTVNLPYPQASVRFGDDAVWFAPERSWWGRNQESMPGPVVVQPLDGSAQSRFDTGFWTDRLQPVPGGMLLFGHGAGEETGFVLGLAGKTASGVGLFDRYVPGGVDLSEMRTQAVNLATQPDGSLLLGWPVFGRQGDESALMFAAITGQRLAARGALDFTDMPDLATQSVAWYGESRVVFLGHRLIAFSGDAVIEGRLAGERVQPLRSLVLVRPDADADQP